MPQPLCWYLAESSSLIIILRYDIIYILTTDSVAPPFTFEGGLTMRANRLLMWIISFFSAFLFLSPTAFATTITVRQDGTGDYYTMPEAVAVASPQDSILVGPGTYSEWVDVSIPLVFISEDGAASTILDGGSSHRHMTFLSGAGSRVEGFTFRNGYYAGSAGSMRVMDGATVSIRNCKFEDNVSGYDGGAIIVVKTGSALYAEGCVFINNYAPHNGGACNAIQNGHLSFVNCSFAENSTDTYGAALACNDGSIAVSGCLFHGNTSGNVAGAIYCFNSSGSLESNTFHGNASPGGATLVLQMSSGISVSQNILAKDTSGYGLQYIGSAGAHTCDLFWNNNQGSISGAPLAPSEIESDPLFCNPGIDDFSIAYSSPADPANNSCGVLIGAYPASCDAHNPIVITVRQDGTGDYYTMPEAVAVALSYDTILVGPGTYTEWVDISCPLIFKSEEGTAVTVLDGEGSHRHMTFLGGDGSEVEGFTFRNGHYEGNGGSIRIMDGSAIGIRDCRFEDNTSDYDGGAIIVVGSGSILEAERCEFINNAAPHNGGACNAIQGGQLSFSSCSFVQNSTETLGAALACNDGSITVSECLFHGNASGDVAGGIYCFYSFGVIKSNTFYMNASPGRATVVIHESPGIVVSQNIFASDASGYGLQYIGSAGAHTCNLFWANSAGSIDGDGLDPSDLQTNPVFCDPQIGDFTVAYASPAAPENNPCGLLLGAFPPACEREIMPPEPLIISILDLPNDHGREVRIKWQRSLYDAPGNGIDITGYGIYRYQGEFAAGSEQKLAPPTGRPERAGALDGWDFIETVPARGDSVYQYVAPTLCDSTVNDGMCWSVFFVSAMTPDPLVYYDSPPDSGYSLDNLAPAMPQGVAGQYDYAPLLLTLHWHPNTEFDLAGYRVYRGEGEEFVPSDENRVAATPDTLVSGLAHFPAAPWYIKVTAVDINGNESVCAVLPPSEVPIATFVSSYQSIWKNGFVEVNWVLNEASSALDVRVLRKARSGDYEDLACAVTREGDRYRFEDASVESGETYSYRIYIVRDGGESLAFETSVAVPVLKLELKQNHPNPFNPATAIPFSVPEQMHVAVAIYDSQGKLVKTILDEVVDRGVHSVPWDGTDAGGNTVASGVYYYRMRAGKEVQARKMLMLK